MTSRVPSLRRLRAVAAFARTSGSPAQWIRLAVLGYSRGNPSSRISRSIHEVQVKPSVLRGASVTVAPHDLGQLISFEEVFVERTYALERVPFTPSLVIDCGSHVGYFSALAAATYPAAAVIAFEPHPGNLAWLRRNLASLGRRASIHAAAVSTWEGTSRFVSEWSNTGRMDASSAAGLKVPVVDLSRYVPRDFTASLLLKVDIEGEEQRVLPHVMPLLPHRCALFVETHDGSAAREAAVRLLEAAGFTVTRVRERGAFADLLAIRNHT